MSTHFGNSNPSQNIVITHAFPFREDGIVVDFEISLGNKVVNVRIGRPYNRQVEVSEIGEYGQLLVAIDTHVKVIEMKLKNHEHQDTIHLR